MISFRERWSGIAPVNVRGVGESRKIVKQTGSGLGVDAQADPGGPSSPDLPLHIRPLRMTFVMGGNSHAGSLRHTPMGTLFLTKRQKNTMGQRASSINGAGKTGQLHVKE